MKPIPVILDTDIGGDIDDTWALAMLLKSRELALKLIVSATDDTTYRAKIICRMLEVAGQTDVPVGIGLRTSDKQGPQARWIEGYDVSDYPGTVYDDGVEGIVRTIGESREPLTLICIGPVPNIAEALTRSPEIARNARFVGMHGSIPRGVPGRPAPVPEYNVRRDPDAFRAVLGAGWKDSIITPLDTCGLVRLDGERFRKIRDSDDPLLCAVIENYRIWAEANERYDPERHSSILFDTVAVYLAFATEYLVIEPMGIRVTDDGFTRPDDSARRVDVAIDWSDLPGYLDFLVERLGG